MGARDYKVSKWVEEGRISFRMKQKSVFQDKNGIDIIISYLVK